MSMKIVFLVVINIYLAGCGTSVRLIENCIPKVSFSSTEKHNFVSYKPLDNKKGRLFDSLDIVDLNEWYLVIAEKNSQDISDLDINAVVVEKHDRDQKLELLGIAKVRKPYGLMTAFQSDIIYFKGKIDHKIVWVPKFYVRGFVWDDDEVNLGSMRKIQMVPDMLDWTCPKN